MLTPMLHYYIFNYILIVLKTDADMYALVCSCVHWQTIIPSSHLLIFDTEHLTFDSPENELKHGAACPKRFPLSSDKSGMNSKPEKLTAFLLNWCIVSFPCNSFRLHFSWAHVDIFFTWQFLTQFQLGAWRSDKFNSCLFPLPLYWVPEILCYVL